MLTEQRHEIILNLLSKKRSITVTELKELLNTSESTIRQIIMDLKCLQINIFHLQFHQARKE